jgi:hypothetical protein
LLAAAAPVRRRRVLYLPGVAPVFAFNCTITPAMPSVATERSIALTATVTGTPQSAVTWEVDGGAANGAISNTGVYKAPCSVPAGPVTVRAKSVFDPNRAGTTSVTVLPGIAVTAQAGFGTPAAAGPSANVGQAITVTIPAATRALTQQGFVVAQNVTFETLARDATGSCATAVAAVAGQVATGMNSMSVTVPPCAAPDPHLRVPGHGCVRLQIVPRITTLNRSAALGQSMGINGSGFACGATQVFFGSMQVSAAQVLSVECNVILVGVRPTTGQAVTVKTSGGTSNAVV